MSHLFLVLLWLLRSVPTCEAFVPTPPSRNRHHRPLSSVSSFSTRTASPSTTTTSTTTSTSKQETTLFPTVLQKTAPTTKNPHSEEESLRLDAQGNLRLGDDRILLNGFDPSMWSTIRPPNNSNSNNNNNRVKANGLFLHTQHAASEEPIGDLVTCHKLLAVARQTRYWMGPKFGETGADIPPETQFMLMQLDKDKDTTEPSYAVFLPLLDNGFRATLQTNNGDKNIQVVCVACGGEQESDNKGMRALYVATGKDPFQLIRTAFRQVSTELGTFRTLEQKHLPGFVDDFGWCTWDAYYSNVTPQGVLDGVESLQKAGTPPRTLILDDGWQQVSPEPIVKDEISSPNKQTKDATNQGLLEKIACSFFNTHVQRAPHGSWGNRLWISLARTVLKQPLWHFLNTETDFTRQLSGFGPNTKFEYGASPTATPHQHSLKNLVSQLKGRLGVKNVLCWHALHGYWRGVSEDLGRQAGLNVTTVFPKPSDNLLRLEPLMESDPVNLFGVGLMSNAQDLKRFYQMLHAPLVEAGVDGVKVDVQSGVSAAGDRMGGGPTLAKLYTRAMEESVEKCFPSANNKKAVNVINCMCHSTENLYRYQLTSVARASEDFFPDRADSQTAHLINIAYNSLFVGEICLPDWDMFHSYGPTASLHAAARAVGGCPIYVSDAPGKHDPHLLRKLVLPDGSILRAQLPGRPTRDCLFANVAIEKAPLKIWNQNMGGSGVVGAFHVQGVEWDFVTHENAQVVPKPVPFAAQIKPYDVETLRRHAGPFAAWRHQSANMEFLPTGDSVMKTLLKPQQWEVATIVPLQVSQRDIMWGPIGLINMINSGGAVTESEPLVEPSSFSRTTRASCTCRGPGRFAAFTNFRPHSVSVNGKEIIFTYEEDSCELSFDVGDEMSDKQPHSILVKWDKPSSLRP
uniref:galactinol--sucrose galactosyltransferase n=1 Tax=Amphora coffeiformis TaxID=265554 RepID=A0A7S3L0E3_9STRA